MTNVLFSVAKILNTVMQQHMTNIEGFFTEPLASEDYSENNIPPTFFLLKECINFGAYYIISGF